MASGCYGGSTGPAAAPAARPAPAAAPAALPAPAAEQIQIAALVYVLEGN